MKLVKNVLDYAGVENPKKLEEIQIEILGLKNAIRQAEERISRLEQVMAIVRLSIREEQEHAVGTRFGRQKEETGVDFAGATQEGPDR